MDFLLWLAAAASAVAPPAAPAAPQHSEKLVVTSVASRVSEMADATPATVTVIEREQLERQLARDLRDAFRYEPGVSVENAAARFGLGNIAIRGLEGNRVQMLQDGIRLPDGFRIGSFSNASRNPFEVGLLSRIEVLRGPGSALYGSDALAGVVSMSTLAPRELLHGARFGGLANVGWAQADRSLHRTAAVAGESTGAQLLVGVSRTDGEARDNRGTVDALGATRTVPNPQDGRSASELAKLVVPTRGGGRWRATYEHFERRVATDVLSLNPQSPRTVSLTGDDRAERTRWSLDATWHSLGIFDQLSLLAYSQRSLTEQDTVEVRDNTTAQCLSAPGPIRCRREARFTFEQDEVGLTAIAQSGLGQAHQLVYGAEWARTHAEEMRDGRQFNLTAGTVSNVVGTDVFPTRDFPRSRVERIGVFAQDEIALRGASLIPALRYDRFEMRPEADEFYTSRNPGRTPVGITDSAWSPKLGLLLPIASHTTLSVQAAAGFRAPPYFDINVGLSSLPLGFTVIPNPDLKPEVSRGLEVGVRGRHGRFDYSVTAFRTHYSDLIVSRAPLACPGDPRCVPTATLTFQSQNVTRARIEGVEARAEARLGAGFTARAGAAWAHGGDRTRGLPLNSVDPAKVVAGLAWQASRGGAELHVTHAARKTRIDSSAGTLFATPSYTIADLTGFVNLGRHVTFHAGVFNLFDRKYWLWSDVRGILNPGVSIDRYTQPGRTFAAQVKVSF